MKYLEQWLSKAHTVIPSFFFDVYIKLGLTDCQFLVLLHIINFKQCGNNFPSPVEIADKMELDEKKCRETIFSLVHLGILNIVHAKDEQGNYYEHYDLTSLYNRVAQSFISESRDQDGKRVSGDGDLYVLFEKEFGRSLTPIELEMIVQWLDVDNIEPNLIKLALKEAVISSVLTFRYIERILFDWQKKGIKTVEQANVYREKFNSQKVSKVDNLAINKVKPKDLRLYDWAKE